jgi:DNA-binding ferritin-like protein
MEMEKLANIYIASIRAVALIHQLNHWLAKGTSSYGDHLLFDRIYNSAQKDADAAAEKFVGVLGENCLEYSLHFSLMNKIIKQYENLSGIELSLRAECDFLKLSKDFYDKLKSEDALTLGTDDLIMSIANNREEAVYLLTQRNS